MKINVHFLPPLKKFPQPTTPFISRVAKATLQSEKHKSPGEMNIIFVNNKKIREINWAFLKERGNTDVIAFPYADSFGDIYISAEQAMKNALAYKQPFEQEIARLVIHGILHILGYTDHAPAKKKIMWKKQEALVQKFYPAKMLP